MENVGNKEPSTVVSQSAKQRTNKETNKNKQRNKQKQTQKQTNKEPRIHGGEPICQGGHTKADLMQIPASLDFEEYNLENSDATYSI